MWKRKNSLCASKQCNSDFYYAGKSAFVGIKTITTTKSFFFKQHQKSQVFKGEITVQNSNSNSQEFLVSKMLCLILQGSKISNIVGHCCVF